MAKNEESFSKLLALRDTLKTERELREKREAIERAKAAEEQKRVHEFENAMNELGVTRIEAHRGRVIHPSEKPVPFPRQKQLDEEAALRDSPSDEFGIDHFLDSDEKLSYRSKNMSPDIPRKLRSGAWSIKGTLDLHGYTSEEARLLLVNFLEEQRKQGHRAVRVIHGQGYGSIGHKPVLKEKVPVWLVQRKEVLSFVQAPEHDGGAGVLYVLLAPYKPKEL